MDGDGGLNMRNWGYYESPSLKSHLGLQLMPSMADREPLLGAGRDSTVLANVNNGGGGPFHHQRDCGIPTSLYQMDYTRDAWIHHRDNKFFSMLPSNSAGYAVMPETTAAAAVATTTQHHHPHPHHPPVHMLRQPESSNDERLMVRTDGLVGDSSINGPSKKRGTGKGAEKGPKTKRPRKAPNTAKDGSSGSTQRSKAAKKTTEVVINGIDMDISSIPIPVCSCTGTPQQCYRWGSGGWQSACCTTVMSMYPLPMSSKRRGARIAGRKMSLGAFKKVLEKLAAEGYNFANPIDLRTHWAKHGTNKFVTIR